jgi:predicted HicB family RNase H-like nuclease
MMEYRGYHAAIKYDHEDEIFHGEVVGTRDVIFFEATSVEELKREFSFSIDDYLAMCEERGQEPDRPFSGRIPLRVTPEIHRAATAAARAEGKSLNAWIAEAVETAASLAR